MRGVDNRMVTTGKVGAQGISKNRGDLHNQGDDFEVGELIPLYGLWFMIE